MIKAIEINAPSNYLDDLGNPLFALYDLDRMNIFVGENNSGKSRLMRMILSNKTCIMVGENLRSKEYWGRFKNSVDEIIIKIQRVNQNGLIGRIDVKAIEAERNSENYYATYKKITKTINEWFNAIPKDNSNYKIAEDYYRQIMQHINTLTQALRMEKDSYGGQGSITEIYKNRCFYIPVLRGIENFDSYFDRTPLAQIDDALLNKKQWKAINDYANNSKQIYVNKVSSAYGINKNCIFTAENLYEEIKEKLLGEEKCRKQVQEFQEFISNAFYKGSGFTLIPRQVKNGQEIIKEYLSVKIGNSAERPIYDLGDGIKQMITILYKVYEKKDEEAVFFIEEPEINLHPGYQHKLIQILQRDIFKKHQFFIVTHSNHVIDSATNTDHCASIYKVINTNEKNSQFKIAQTTKHDIEILDLLGVSNSSVFMANCSIFVEGISDKIIIQKYLETYMCEKKIEFKEDVHYTFIETGGGNIAHWNFLTELNEEDFDSIHASSFSNRSFVICDNDDGKKQGRKDKIAEMVGENNFYILPVREIENTIKRDVLEKVLFGNNEVKIKKSYNEHNNSGYDNNKHIGRFIDSHYDLKKEYSTSSGTIKNKIQFAREVASNIHTIDDLSERALELCSRLLAFIQDAN